MPTLLQRTKVPEADFTEPAKAGHVTETPWQAESDAQPDVAQMLMHERVYTSWLWHTKVADAVIFWQLRSR